MSQLPPSPEPAAGDGLITNPCRTLCSWRPIRAVAADGTGLFACSGCGSQWRPGLGWTPADRDGSIPAEVGAALRATSDRCAGAAGTSGT